MKALDLMYAMGGIPDDVLLEAEKSALPKPAKQNHRIPFIRLTAAILALLLLVGCVAGTLEINLWNGGKTQSWNRVDMIATNHNLQLPDTLLNAPFLDCQFLHLTDRPTSYFLGRLFPEYRYYTVFYGTEVTLRDYHRNENGMGYRQWTERNEVISITFGSTANQYWRRQFGYNEEDIWTGGTAVPIATDTRTQAQLTWYLATYESGQEFPRQTLRWYDYERGVIVRLQTHAPTWDSLITAAEEILALNP